MSGRSKPVGTDLPVFHELVIGSFAMSGGATSNAAYARAVRDRLAQVRTGMRVEDEAGEQIGSVAYVQIGESCAIEPADLGALTGEGVALDFGAHPEPAVPPEMVSRFLLIGYIKVEDKRRFRPDHHFYATADEIVSVDDNGVRLGKRRDELIKSRK